MAVPVRPVAFFAVAVAVAVASVVKHGRLEGHERRGAEQKVREDPPQLDAVQFGGESRAERRAEHGGAAQNGRGGGVDETGVREVVRGDACGG